METATYWLLNDYDVVDRQHFQFFSKADHCGGFPASVTITS
jgi:hypothetical protein